MDTLRSLADHTIRRAMGCAAFSIALVMLMLAGRPMLAMQSGALMTAALWLGLWAAALRVPRMDLRGTRLWPVLAGRTRGSCAAQKAGGSWQPSWPSG
jgi:hypothetical protein